MQETVSWKGHSFTLLVFAGIVVLCSIFFVLGMLVGRTHEQRGVEASTSAPRVKSSAVQNPEEAKLEAPDVVVERAPVKHTDAPAPPRESVKPPAPAANVIHYQIGAVARSNAADKLLREVQKRGFPAFILAPAPSDPSPLFRVQVGPYASDAEAELAKRKLESLGYKPILKK